MGSPENFQMQYDLLSELAAAAQGPPGRSPQQGPPLASRAGASGGPPHPPGRTPPPEVTELSASVTRTTTRSEHKRRRCGPDLSLEQDGQSRELFREEAATPGDGGGGGGGGGGSPGGSRRVAGGGGGGCREEEQEAAVVLVDPVDASSQQEPPAALAFPPEEQGALDTCDGFFQDLLNAPEGSGGDEERRLQQRQRQQQQQRRQEEENKGAAAGAGSSESLFRQELSKVMLGGGCSRGGAQGAAPGAAGCGREAAGDSQGSTDHPQEAPAVSGSTAAGPVGEKANGGEEDEEDPFGTPVAKRRRRAEGGGGVARGGRGRGEDEPRRLAVCVRGRLRGVPGARRRRGGGHAARDPNDGAAVPLGAADDCRQRRQQHPVRHAPGAGAPAGLPGRPPKARGSSSSSSRLRGSGTRRGRRGR